MIDEPNYIDFWQEQLLILKDSEQALYESLSMANAYLNCAYVDISFIGLTDYIGLTFDYESESFRVSYADFTSHYKTFADALKCIKACLTFYNLDEKLEIKKPLKYFMK